MRYYLLLWIEGQALEAEQPRTERGEWISAEAPRHPRPWDVACAVSQVPTDAEYPEVHSAEDLPDYLFLGGIEMLVTLKVKMLLDELRVGEEVGFLRTRMVNMARKYLADYYLVYSRAEHNVLDLTRSQVRYYQDTDLISEIHEWALDPASIPPYDLFLAECKWIATETLKDRFEMHRVTGVRFVPIWSHEKGPLAKRGGEIVE
jgi:hypothetical protein